MKSFRIFFSVVILIAISAIAIPYPEYPFEPDSLEKIDSAQRAGLIDEESALVYKVKAYSNRGKLPKEFQSETVITCGTSIMDELAEKWGSLSDNIKTEIKRLLPEAVLFGTKSDIGDVVNTFTNTYKLDKFVLSKKKGNHFILYYTTSGSNAVSSKKYVQKVGKNLEKGYKWIKKVYSRTAKNASPMPVFFIEREYGVCTYFDSSGTPPTAASYITMERDLDKKISGTFKNYGKLLTQAVPVHEYFHAVQNNFDCTQGKFMKEASSCWSEGVIYRGNKLYVTFRVPLVYNNPKWPFWYGSGYAGTLFMRFCQENFKTIHMNAEMWKICETVAGNNSIAAINSVLGTHGSNWDEALLKYGANNYFKRYWDYKKTKKFWPDMTKTSHNSYGVDPQSMDNLFETGNEYIEFIPPADLDLKKGAELLIKFKPTGGSPVATLLMERAKRKFDAFNIPMDSTDANGYYEYLAEGFGKRYKTAVLMVRSKTATGTLTEEHKYDYAAAVPQINMDSFTANPTSIKDSSFSTLTLQFDVKGCWSSMDYPLKYKMHIRGPGKVTDGVTDLIVNVRNGDNQIQKLYFNSGSGSGYVAGTYKLGIQFIFGSSKKMTSRTKIAWTSVVLEKLDKPITARGNSLPSLTIK